jgi:hypothetical protein
MLSFLFAFTAFNALLIKYGFMSWLDSIQAFSITATLAALYDLAMKLIFGN